jgi:hypothetical protein
MNSDDHEEQQIRAALQQAFPQPDQELGRDLWPRMAERLESRKLMVPWYDWTLAAGLVAAVFVFPKLVLFFAYQL